jgi:flagellar assembly factor FliW
VKLENTRFGTLDVDEEQFLTFPHGVIGFPQAHHFIILEQREDSPLKWIQAIEVPELAFVIIDPVPLVPDYPLERIRHEAGDLDWGEQEEMGVAALVTVPPAPDPPTVNLLAPLVIGVDSRRGKQVVLHESGYETRHVLLIGTPAASGEQDSSGTPPK